MTPAWPDWGRSATRYAVGALVTAAIVVAAAMPSEPAAWSVVALVVVLGATTGQSVTASFNRMAGSLVGCLTGAVVQVAMPWLWLPLRVAVAVVACMLLCRLLRISAGMRLGMALAGFFVFVPGDQEWVTVGWRLLATVIGIAVALVVALVLWPSTSRDRLATGIRSVLDTMSESLSSARAALEGDGAPAAVSVASVPALRPLVADLRFEPGGKGPGADALSGVLDGLDLAATGVRRLGSSLVVGPEQLARLMADDLVAVIDDLVAACASLEQSMGQPLAGRYPSGPLQLDADARLSEAIERLRSSHVTPAAGAQELRDLFGAVEALSLIAQGLERAQSSL